MSIRTKLLAIALLPLLATAFLVTMVFSAQSITASNAASAGEDFDRRSALTAAAVAISFEMIDAAQGSDSLEAATDVNRALVANPDFTLEVSSSMDRAAVLVSEARSMPAAESLWRYQDAIEDLLDTAAIGEVPYPSIAVADNANAVDGVIELIRSSDEAWVFFAQLGDEAVAPEQLTEMAGLFAVSESARADLRRLGSGETAATIQTTLRLTEAMSGFKQAATTSLYSQNRRLITPEDGLSAARDYRQRWVSVYERTSGTLGFQISQDRSQARRHQILAALGGLLALIVIGSLGRLVHRSITTPIQALLDGTDRLSGELLPEMIAQMREAESEDALPPPQELEKRSADEIGDLVSSFNDIGRLVHRLATEQLAIRENATETLFAFGDRQARQLDKLILALNGIEIDEQNIALLAKLGELDHLASTIRRSAQSMVVLGGDYTERSWSRPVSVDKIGRASVANVEAYDRVNLTNLVPGFVKGAASADVQHILAELTENALNNSSPRSRVVIEGFWSGERYVLIVSDDGPGMSSAEISVNNRRINSLPRLRVGPVTKLGLSVVGSLANRHDIDVQLTPKEHGVNAVVTLPAKLVSHTDEVQVPTSLGGAPAPRTQRAQVQIPSLSSQTMPPGALQSAPEDAASMAGELSGEEDRKPEWMKHSAANNPDSGAGADYEIVAIPPALESVRNHDSAPELASPADPEHFKGPVDEKMAAAIEALTRP